jgi:addiction module HigA family antidote
MNKLPPIHPGETLRDFLEEFEMSQSRLATELRVPVFRINALVNGKRGITADTALRLGKFFDNTPEFWLNLQQRYELETAKDALREDLAKIHSRAA